MIDNICIIGAGPAGSYLAYLLARSGIYATIFDHSHPREKPCGGGISPFALSKFPFLKEISCSQRFIDKAVLISPKGREAILNVGTGMNVSRKHFDSCLLQRALDSGARLVAERVVNVRKQVNSWVIRTQSEEYHSRLIVGADGVNSIVRRTILSPIPKEDLAACIGYFSTNVEIDYCLMRFYEGLQGYAWVFPRESHSSIGIVAKMKQAKNLKAHLNRFIEEYCPNMERVSAFGALVPMIRHTKFYEIPCSGEDWILIGDAAGHVDPILVEGIRYAIWSAELAAEAIIDGDSTKFDTLWRSAYYRNFIEACRLAELWYNPRVIDLIVMMASRSKSFERLLAGLVMKEQNYNGLIKNLFINLPAIALDCTLSYIKRQAPLEQTDTSNET